LFLYAFTFFLDFCFLYVIVCQIFPIYWDFLILHWCQPVFILCGLCLLHPTKCTDNIMYFLLGKKRLNIVLTRYSLTWTLHWDYLHVLCLCMYWLYFAITIWYVPFFLDFLFSLCHSLSQFQPTICTDNIRYFLWGKKRLNIVLTRYSLTWNQIIHCFASFFYIFSTYFCMCDYSLILQYGQPECTAV